MEAVVNEIRQERIQQLESLQEGFIKVRNDLTHPYLEDENMVTNLTYPDMKDSNRTLSRCLRRASTIVKNCATRLLLERMDQVKKKVNDVDEGLR